MDKNKLLKILNKSISGKSFISEISRTEYINNAPNSYEKFLVSYIYQNFVSDGNGDGYHESEYKIKYYQNEKLKRIQREINIESLLSEHEDTFNIESKIYTKEQLSKLNEMRNKNTIKNPNIITMTDYYSTFKVGTKVVYKGENGVITFMHKPNRNDHLRFTVKSNGKETRYVDPFIYNSYGCRGLKLLKRRKKIDYSGVEIPKSIKSMRTKDLIKLLGTYRKSKYYDADVEYTNVFIIKSELSKREHIPNKKIKKHGGSKSKNR